MINKLIVMQPTSLCNLNCSYCYVPDRQNAKVMSHDTLDSAFRVIYNSMVTKPQYKNEKTIISWHSGEPLTAKLPFYKKAAEIFAKYDKGAGVCEMNLQTNAILINQEWCDFFKDNQYKIGVSSDGPEFIHNHYRKDWNQKGSFSRVMRGINLLKKNGIPITSISVLTDHSICYPDEMYQFFKENGFNSVGFNIDELEGSNTQSSYRDSVNKQVNYA